MTASDKQNRDILACISQMPQDMKKRIIANIEYELGMTISEYKESRFKAAELLVADVKTNPENYTTASLTNRLGELLYHFETPKPLEQEIMRVKMFIASRHTTKYQTDGSVDLPENITYEEYSKDWPPIKSE